MSCFFKFSFSNTNRHGQLSHVVEQINTLAQDNLTLHQQRIKKYEHVRLWGCFRHPEQPHPILLLRDICNDWRVAYYARSLAIECCGRDPIEPDPDPMDPMFAQAALIARDFRAVKSVLPGITIPVRKMLSMAFRWNEAKINKVFREAGYGAWGVWGAIPGLLTVSLPAIRSISLKRYVWRDQFWTDSMKSIADQQSFFSRTPKPNFLMDVSELNLEDDIEGPSAGMSCSVIPFVSLPSMRVIRGASVESWSFDDYHFCDNHGLPPLPVTEIDLQRTSLPAHYLEYVLRYSRVLKRFRYDRGPEYLRSGAEPGEISKTLLECARHSLESLVLTGGTASRSPGDENIDGLLRGFKVLKEIHLPSNAFLTYTSRGKCLSKPTEDIPRLVDVLPASIETVRLDGEMTWEDITALLIGMPENRIKGLPKLKEILFTVGENQGRAPTQVKALSHLDQKHGMVLQFDRAVESPSHCTGRITF